MRIAVWAGSGVGGTEKAATTYAGALAHRGWHVDFLGPPGPRTGHLEDIGVRILGLKEPEEFRQYIRHTRPDVIHQHVPGYPIQNPLYTIWPTLGAEKPRLIETNVFGWLKDPFSAEFVDFRTFISLASAAQCFRRSGQAMTRASLQRQTVLFYPLEPEIDDRGFDRSAFRASLGVNDDEVLAIRIGQRGPKWREWECEAFVRAKRIVPNIRLLLMEPPEPLWKRVESGQYGNGIILRRVTSDFGWIYRLNRAADLTVHASTTGESFGYTLAEAATAGQPLVVRTTPWYDNAQVELVENGRTGFVCGSVSEMARRWAELARDASLRARMGAAGRAHVRDKTLLDRETNVLEAILDCVCVGKRQKILDQRTEEILAFAQGFPAREWDISEKPFEHPCDYFGARTYAIYRRFRAFARAYALRLGMIRDT